MLLIRCPYCETERPELEFKYGGEGRLVRPDPNAASDEEWTDFLYFRANTRGRHAERWRHAVGCGRFFNCLRDTVSDRIMVTYRFGEKRPEDSAPSPLAGEGGVAPATPDEGDRA